MIPAGLKKASAFDTSRDGDKRFFHGVMASAEIMERQFGLFAPDVRTLELLWLRVMHIPLNPEGIQRVKISDDQEGMSDADLSRFEVFTAG